MRTVQPVQDGFRQDRVGGHARDGNINSANNTSSTAAIPNGTAPILTTVKGQFNGGGERAQTVRGPNPVVSIKNGTASGAHLATAYPLSFGHPSTRVPVYTHFFSTPTLSIDGNTTVINPSCTYGDDCIQLGSIANNFCFLSSVSGDFNGSEEWASVFPDSASGQWLFHVSAGTSTFSTSSVYAQAECLVLDQRDGSGVIR